MRGLVVVLSAVALCFAVSAADFVSSRASLKTGARRNYAVSLGRLTIRQGVTEARVPKAHLDVDAVRRRTPELKGQVRNRTKAPLDAVTITIRNSGVGAGTPPQAGSARITHAGKSSSSQFKATGDGGWRATTILTGGTSSAAPIASGASADLEIELINRGKSPPFDFLVRLTGSVKNKPRGAGNSIHADVYEAYFLDLKKMSRKNQLVETWHDRIAARIKNVDASRTLAALTCDMSLPTGVAVSSVVLQDPSSGYRTVPGSSTLITGNRFTVSGFSLVPGGEYEIVVVFDTVPKGSTALQIEATFAQQ